MTSLVLSNAGSGGSAPAGGLLAGTVAFKAQACAVEMMNVLLASAPATMLHSASSAGVLPTMRVLHMAPSYLPPPPQVGRGVM